MPITKEIFNAQIDRDHRAIQESLSRLAGRLEERVRSADFIMWKHETTWAMEELHLGLRRHFSLEELVASDESQELQSPAEMERLRAIESEHRIFLSELEACLRIIRDMNSGDVLRQHHLKNKIKTLKEDLESHEQQEQDLIAGLIKDFVRSGRFSEHPAFRPEEIAGWEEELALKLPEHYKSALAAGEYDKANFEFIRPYFKGESKLLIFSHWNDVKFAFDTTAAPDFPVYVLVDGLEPDRAYKNFLQWFRLVYSTTSQANNPD